jgi:3'5'-cyclic nucleotide phosphodiesterase
VALSVIKLLGRIVIPNDIEPGDARHAFSDPLTQFTCVLGALIHDVWHSGVPNAQLVIEKAEVASQYYNCSIAEQASIDVAWQLLMQPDYDALRSAIYCDQVEMDRFRYLLVNAVMATDISDARLKETRNKQWDLAFNNDDSEDASPQQVSSRKAVIVVQTLIQASDLSHTMQHWHVYQKWNQRLFDEMMTAYRLGRSDKDPSEGWYEGELWFFENVVIPLAKRLKDCGVFGVSSEEYLNYAIRNCEEWKACGSDAVREMQGKLINRATSRSEIA